MEEVKSKDTKLNIEKLQKPHELLDMDHLSSHKPTLHLDWSLAILMSSRSRQLMLLEIQDHPCHLAPLNSKQRLIPQVLQELPMPQSPSGTMSSNTWVAAMQRGEKALAASGDAET